MPLSLLPTSLVGSYAQPDWLLDCKNLAGRFPPRVRAKELWRVAPEFLDQAQDDATLLAIHDQERAGLDIITDGEIRRESYSNRFATALEGVDIDNPGTALDRSGHPNPVPRITGKVRRKHPVEVKDVQFLRANTNRTIKITVPGPFTMSQQAQNDYYKNAEEMVLDYAAVIHVRPEGYSFLPEFAHSPVQQVSIETAQSNLDVSILAKLPGKTIILGVLDLSDMAIEQPETVAARIRRALKHVAPERIVVAPDCGLKYLPREVAFGKMCAMVEGTKIVRKELEG